MLTRIVRQSLLSNKSNIARTFTCGVDPNVETKRQKVLQRRQKKQVAKAKKKRKHLINDDSTPKLTITDKGWNEISKATSDKSAFRLSSTEAGSMCGMQYDFRLVDINELPSLENATYVTHPEKEDIKVYIDERRQFLLIGASIDYEEKDYEAGKYESGFVVSGHPMLTNDCACNKSFKPIDL